jgi:hypothetical protein
VSEADVRELAGRGLAEEGTGPRGEWVGLTREGLAQAVALLRRAAAGAARRGGAGRKRPRWRHDDGHLLFAGVVVKQFTRGAENQRCVLDRFERDGWAPSVENPLPRKLGVDRKLELRRTVESLNEGQAVPLVRFHAEGGRRVRWEAVL